MNEREKYADIIGLPRHVSERHARMSTADRAKLFAPFAALSGYDEAVRERGTFRADRPELSADAGDALDTALGRLARALADGRRPEAAVVCFSGDGAITSSGPVTSLDTDARVITVFGEHISLDDIDEIMITKI